MRTIRIALIVIAIVAVFARSEMAQQGYKQPQLHAKETHLRNIKQLTFGGENAEAYFSLDGKQVILQSTRPPYKCDQIFTMNADGSNVKMVSTGKGRTTCAYFMPDGKRVIYASTHLGSPDCPPVPDRALGYIWALYPSFDIFSAKTDGTDMKRLTNTNRYDAEGTVSTDGKKIVFTSLRSGDLEIWDMNIDGSQPRQLTNELGYDGGPWHSQDGQWITWRASRPKTPEDVQAYKDLIAKDLVKPDKLEIMVMRADGSQKKQLTSNGKANFAPYFHPNGRQIIFVSNVNNPNPRSANFDLFLVNRDGTGLEQITFDEAFDGFPMFSNDGKKLIWASNRNSKTEGETDVFIADWVEKASSSN
jgi:Periplasmic component of the Tol biopolymer transport system